MRHPDIEIDSLLKLARAAREMERNAFSVEFNAAEVRDRLAATIGESRAVTLIEMILDHEDRLADFLEHWKSWRRCTRRVRRGRA